MASKDYYRKTARGVLLGLLVDHLALTWSEIEARAADEPAPRTPHRIEPHHLGTARSRLFKPPDHWHSQEPTRGGRLVRIFHPPPSFIDGRGLRRRFETAAGRKRLLEGRYLGWASGQQSVPSLIGRGGEWAVQASLREASTRAFLVPELPTVEIPNVRTLFGAPVPIGPLDNAARLMVDGGRVVQLVIEVKNVREWLYSSSQEVFQLLAKASALQEQNKDQLIVPVLICRRSHATLMRMAFDLGFYIIPTFVQYVYAPYFADNEKRLKYLAEINTELRYNIKLADKPVPHLVRQLSLTLPGVAQRQAERWRDVGSLFVAEWETMRVEDDGGARRAMLTDIRHEVEGLPHYQGGWAQPTADDEEDSEAFELEWSAYQEWRLEHGEDNDDEFEVDEDE